MTRFVDSGPIPMRRGKREQPPAVEHPENNLSRYTDVYSKEVMDHFSNPRNVGVIENPDGSGEVGNPVCGDMMKITILVEDDVITDIKFQTLGCGAAIATSSITTEMAKGKSLKEAMKITRDAVAENLGGLPPNKMHCSNLAADALQKAIEDYLKRQGRDIKNEKV